MNSQFLWSHISDIVGKIGRDEAYFRMLRDQRELQATEADFLQTSSQQALDDFLAHYVGVCKRAVDWEVANWRTIKRDSRALVRQDAFLRNVVRMHGVKHAYRPVLTQAGVRVTPQTLEWFEEARIRSPNAIIVRALQRALLAS